MYYPFLRARQFELITVRELAAERVLQRHIVPVLEPVKESFSNLNLANSALVEHGQSAFLILNPESGDLIGDHQVFCHYLSGLAQTGFIAAFHYTNNAEYISAAIGQYQFTGCMLVLRSNFTDDPALRQLCASAAISHIMVLDPQKNRSLDRYIKSLEKVYIRLDDVFEKKEKNADFLGIAAHKFSEEHLYYLEDGYQGFADYTVLPSEFVDGGSTPRAVVIHLTYINAEEEDQVWIRHFTSETNDSIANVQGKFAEAAAKALEFCDHHPLDNSAIQELRFYYDQQRYPGLGIVKKISMKNHLLIIQSYLSR